MASGGANKRLSPPLSLAALGLAADGSSTLDEALQALVRAHADLQDADARGSEEEQVTFAEDGLGEGEGGGSSGGSGSASGSTGLRRRGGSAGRGSASQEVAGSRHVLPPRDELFVLFLPGPGRDDVVLGGTFASRSGQQRLSELGVTAAAHGKSIPRLCLAARGEVPQKPKSHWLRCRGCLRCRSRRGCIKSCRSQLWQRLPKRWQEKLQPWCQQLAFACVCARWAARMIWEDRHELWSDAKSFLGAGKNSPPPCSAAGIREELRPFLYALVFGVLLVSLDMGHKIVWAPEPMVDMSLE